MSARRRGGAIGPTEPRWPIAVLRVAMAAGMAANRIGDPEDLTVLVRWLMSDASTFANWAFFAVGGGLTA